LIKIVTHWTKLHLIYFHRPRCKRFSAFRR